jgi:argininosuccinate synthase
VTRNAIVLAYSGGPRGSAAIGWLRAHHGDEIVTLTVDVGQERDLEEIRVRALALGAVRAHVLDRREAFADAAIAALRAAAGAALQAATIAGLAPPVIARALAEVAAIERATMVAHAADAGAARLDVAIARHTALPIVSAAAGTAVPAPQAGDALPAPAPQWTASRHLLCRPVAGAGMAAPSSVDVAFAGAVPVSVNGVAFSAAELLECLSLLAGRQAVGRLDGVDAPAASVLHAAYAALRQPDGVVRVTLHGGECRAVAFEPTPSPSS